MRIKRLVCWLFISLWAVAFVHAESAAGGSTDGKAGQKQLLIPADPAASGNSEDDEAPVTAAADDIGLGEAIFQVILFLSILGAAAWLFIYYRRRGIGGIRAAVTGKNEEVSSRLQILDTKILGNRQFLVVAAYGKRQVLLGVGPGSIRYLCRLDEEDAPIQGDKSPEAAHPEFPVLR